MNIVDHWVAQVEVPDQIKAEFDEKIRRMTARRGEVQIMVPPYLSTAPRKHDDKNGYYYALVYVVAEDKISRMGYTCERKWWCRTYEHNHTYKVKQPGLKITGHNLRNITVDYRWMLEEELPPPLTIHDSCVESMVRTDNDGNPEFYYRIVSM